MKYNMQKIKEIVEPIFKKYKIKVKCNQLYCSISWKLDNNTIVWDGGVIPRNVKDIITYYTDGPLYIDNYCIPSNRLEKMRMKQLVSYIDSVIGIYKSSREFSDKKDFDYLVPNGKFICWKQGVTELADRRIIKLEVPAKAKRYQAIGEKKFRVSEAKVLGIYDMCSKTSMLKKVNDVEVTSLYDPNFKYRVGEVVKPNSWDECEIACSNGLHAFLRFEDAIKY